MSGIQIYDDPTTEIIEGIRVNGETITSYTNIIDLDNPKEYLVEVRMVYADGLSGTIAKISNGDFDFKTILEEPLLAMQVAYYGIAALSILLGGLGISASKKKKVKTADDIAALVDVRVKEGCDAITLQYASLLKDNMLPVFNTIVDSNRSVVKAITLSTSKNKEAPLALLDVLQEVSDTNVNKLIDDARQEVLKNLADTEAKRHAIHDTLDQIAHGTYQEVQNVQEIESVSEPHPKTECEAQTTVESKSVF
jgi:hypothetical protein